MLDPSINPIQLGRTLLLCCIDSAYVATRTKKKATVDVALYKMRPMPRKLLDAFQNNSGQLQSVIGEHHFQILPAGRRFHAAEYDACNKFECYGVAISLRPGASSRPGHFRRHARQFAVAEAKQGETGFFRQHLQRVAKVGDRNLPTPTRVVGTAMILTDVLLRHA